MADKLDKNLSGTQITNEIIYRTSSGAARLDHDTIFATGFVVSTASGGGGTVLTLTTDYVLAGEDTDLTTEVGSTIYTTLAIVNGAYQNTTLYVQYKTVGDYIEAADHNNLKLATVSLSIFSSNQTINLDNYDDGYIHYFKVTGGTGTYTASFTSALNSYTLGGRACTLWSLKGNGKCAIRLVGTDYEIIYFKDKATFTPTLLFGGASTGITYTRQLGEYTYDDGLVTGSVYLALTSKGTATGTATIGALPYSNRAGDISRRACSLRLSGVTFADYPEAYIESSGTSISLNETTNAGTITVLTNSDFTDTATILVTFFYREY